LLQALMFDVGGSIQRCGHKNLSSRSESAENGPSSWE
jgi:hypothetical protein